mmetsp:Transcript_84593/g.213359  ORF Transcript_84593/g.213359 Transcript_84593/m.213359 type:complete len:510 (-) Transcript_84593:388-1917(-)
MGTKANLTGLLRVYWSLLLGNIVEWYEYAVYGYLAVYLEHHFFQGSEVATWLGFAVTFLARPLGGVVLGSIGDTYGRGFSVNLSIVGMLLGTCGQGLLPTYSSGNNVLGTIGLIVLVILRFVQGLSAAGEISTISTYMVEVGEQKSLGRSISLISVTANLGNLLAKGVVWLVTLVCGVENVKSWAWRLPFILALIPGLIAVWGRQYVPESEEFVQEQRKQSTRESTADPVDSVGVENSHHPDVEADSGTVVRRETTVSRVQSVFSSHWASMLIGVGSVASFAILQYGGFVWTQSFLAHHGMTRDNRMLVGLCARLLMIVLAVPVGWLADVKGVGFVTFIGAGGLAVTAVPLWWMLQSNPTSLETVLLTLGIGFALNGAMVGTVLFYFVVELFPTAVRNTAVGISYNVGFAFFGGLAPVLNSASARWTPLGPGILLALGGFITLVTVLAGLRLQRQEKLRMAHVRAEPYFSKAYDKGTGGPCGLSESESDTTTGTSSESMNADSSGDELS